MDADTCKVVCELRAPRKQRACNQFANLFPFITVDYFSDYAFSHALHCFTKNRIVHEFVEVFSKPFVAYFLNSVFIHCQIFIFSLLALEN